MARRKTRVLKLVLRDDTNFTINVAADYSVVAEFDASDEFAIITAVDGSELIVPKRDILSVKLDAAAAG